MPMEAIVLKAQDYKEKERILTLYTKERGLASVLVKGIGRRNAGITSPPAHADFTVKEGRSELLVCREASLINCHLEVRKSLRHIQATANILNTLYKSQLPSNPSPPLFSLLSSYLTHLPSAPHPETLALSFALKLKRHEGELNLDPAPFSQEEWENLLTLVYARTFAPIIQMGEANSIAAKLII
jgi:DNA repair protein RecO (recombination protein O)